MQSSEEFRKNRLNLSSNISTKNSLLNGIISSDHLSQPSLSSSTTTPNHSPNQIRSINILNNQLKSSKKQSKYYLFIIFLTFIYSFLLILIIELLRKVFKQEQYENDLFLLLNITKIKNQTKYLKEENNYISIKSFFACVWFFNLLLFLICLFIHIFIYKTKLQSNQITTSFIRDFGEIFNNDKLSSQNTLIDYLIKICLLCLLWYLFNYLFLRSISILISSQIIILYSITITLREILGWIFLHELFIGNKIVALILSLSSLLFLIHNDQFHFNKYFLGLTLITSSVIIKTIFDILIISFIKELTSTKLRIIVINICLCGTCLLWPFILLFHFTHFEYIQFKQFNSLHFLITLIFILVFNIFKISIPIKYTKISYILSFLIVIPSISLIDYYLFNIKYSSLIISSIICSLLGVILSIIPNKWFQFKKNNKMKQAFSLINKDSNINYNNNNGISSTFQQLRAQRRITNAALLYNDIKT